MSSNENSVSLEQKALQRREKLLALKRKREGKGNEDNPNSQHSDLEALPRPIFRSYKPSDENLHESALPTPKPEDVSAQVKDQLESGKSKIILDQLDVTALAPRKPDWDLKRDISKRMDKLERLTQRTIAELIRERLKERNEDLASMVNLGAESVDR
ncbi:hypothetical protein GWI33_012108 [Rhynchophorus ferrugineus]|uniref:Coiled-coil domain-containing protein 12 n=1 Tax=Rhynchophorus ferrugineus TaxID=354439 RepID=A0A834I8U2_RHYFE|nr:hypothetical protein GWI33_012108 [Rhynchophorus ferrugineus]